MGECHDIVKKAISASDHYVSILEKEIERLTKDRDRWKASHDNQVKLKSAIIDRLDCGDRARKVVALFDRIEKLEQCLAEIYHSTSCTTHQMELINKILPQG